MGTDNAVKQGGDPGLVHLEVYRLRVSIGDQHDPAWAALQRGKKILGAGAGLDEVPFGSLQGNDVELQFAAPEVCAIPVERAA